MQQQITDKLTNMKIALVPSYDLSYPGGVTEHTTALANGLRRRGHDVHILAACSGYQSINFPNTRAITQNITTIPIAGTVARVGLSPLSYIRIRKILQGEAFDVLHLQEPLTPSITWWFLVHAHDLPRTAIIGTFHAYHEKPNWFYKQGRPIFGKLFAKLDSLIAVSQAAYHFAYQMFPGDYRIITNGIDMERFGRSMKAISDLTPAGQKRDIRILFVGRLDKRKGFSVLLEAFIKLKRDYPGIKLQVIGPFDAKICRPYKKMARCHGVTDIEFLGYISPERLPEFYHKADIFCAPSLGFESFGIVLLEAMAAGLPIVASDIVGYRSVITHRCEGFLAPPGQPDELVWALKQLIDYPGLRRAMGTFNRAKADQFSWDVIVDQTLELYLETIQRKINAPARFLCHTETNNKLDIHIQRRQATYVKRSSTQI